MFPLAAPSIARGDSSPAFKTPGEAAYCQMEFTRNSFDAFRCFTPNDGWWIKFTGLMGQNVQVAKGYDNRYRGYRSGGYSVLRFGKTWWSSDAEIVTCWSRTSGLTCKHYDGLTFWIGRYKGYRIYVSPAGSKPAIAKPLFRTVHGFYCGLAASMEPDAPSITCWRPKDGVELSLYHQHSVLRGAWSRNENARGYRPAEYPVLSGGGTFRWRCARVDAEFATACSRSGRGTTVFTCTSQPSRLTCRNDTNHGFWLSRSSFYTW